MKDRNENRPGYKKTKVGWIPEDWEATRLDSVSSIKTGPFGAQLHQSDYVEIGTPIITVEHIGEGGIRHHNLPKVSDEDKGRLSKYILKEGDIVFSRVGSVDRNSFVSKKENGWLFSGRLLRIRPDNSKLVSIFLSYFLNQAHIKNFVRSIAVGGTMPSLNTQLLSSVYISLPPYHEQKKMAEILSTWDETIEQTRKLIEAKKLRKKALMQQLFTGKRRLPGFSEPWREYPLGDLFDERIEINNHQLPLLAITGSRGVIPASEIERKDSSTADKSRYKRIAPGDIGYNTMRMWQGVSAVSSLEGIVSPVYTVGIPKEAVDAWFMGYLFKFPPVVHLFRRYSQGLVSDTLNLKFPNFAKIRVTIPGLDEQRLIRGVLSTIDEEIETLETKLSALEKQKRGLMQKLLTGEVRVKL